MSITIKAWSIFLLQRLTYAMLESASNVTENAICSFKFESNLGWSVLLFAVII